MKNIHKISLQISTLTFFVSIVFLWIFLFLYNWKTTIKDIFVFLTEVDSSVFLFLFLFSLVVWYGSGVIVGNIFQKIEQHNAQLKDYNHFVAHELKTPISVIQSNLDVLSYGFDEKKIQQSKIELNRMVEIIDRLLHFSESFSAIHKQDINLENFLNKCIGFTDYKNNITIHNTLFNFSIFTDETLFERVVKNLIENAMKYAPDKQLHIFIQPDMLIFENMTYKHFCEEELQYISQKFYSKSYNENTGAGLWLAIIRDILRVLWYKLEIQSENETFRVKIIF